MTIAAKAQEFRRAFAQSKRDRLENSPPRTGMRTYKSLFI